MADERFVDNGEGLILELPDVPDRQDDDEDPGDEEAGPPPSDA